MPNTIGVILAGGQSRRMGADKATIMLASRPLIAHVIERLAPQVDALAISANDDPERFAHLGLPVFGDEIGGVAGPLAGAHAAAGRYPHDDVVTVAVDLPFLPRDLVTRLRAAIGETAPAPSLARGPRLDPVGAADCAYATCNGRHAAAILWRAGQAGALAKFLSSGGRRVEDWLAAHGVAVEFPASAEEDVLFNINTPDDLASAEERIRG
jgi:molybdopterin-guanine dinucleotide biosynthesis protein A